MVSSGPFAAFHEAEVNFKPTYKFDVGTNAYDTSEKRRPNPNPNLNPTPIRNPNPTPTLTRT